MTKPPIGVKPIQIFLEERISDLGRAIGNYTMRGFVVGENATRISTWCTELTERISEYQQVLWDEESEEES